jgi:basic membrane protein A
MKKVVTILLVLAMILSVVACAPAATPPPAEEAPVVEATEAPVVEPEVTEAPLMINVAMVTDVGNIDDKSFNEFTWMGCKNWAADNGMVANYYRPSEDSDEARIEAIKTAIEKGANVIVCPGYLFGATYQQLPQQYPEVMFLGIDLGLGDVPEPQANTALITYQEEQSGYLAGYAAVMDGYTKLAFLGGIDVPAVVRFGSGFVQGADAAAAVLGNTADVSVKYWYSGAFWPTDEIKTKTAGWYTEGTEIIFAAGGGILFSAIASADEADGKLIGVDVDQSVISERIITSAKKELENSVKLALSDLLTNGGTWSPAYGGAENKLGAAQDCVGLPLEAAAWRFSTFTVEQYNEIFAKVKNGEVAIASALDVHPTVAIAVDYQN